MSDSSKAVFLSYASQDAEAAKRICEALRAVGVEVWFDQSELVGGDSWDAKIRGQIGSCALFVPLISANTQARLEGYFRLEWKLAAQRTHTMADEKTFLLPVVIDATRDAEAKVPVEFKAVQWTKLPGSETPEKFCQRVKALLGGEEGGDPSPRRPSRDSDETPGRLGETSLPSKQSSRPWLVPTILGAAVVVIALWQPWRGIEKSVATATPPPAAAPLTEARKLAARADAMFDQTEDATRGDLDLAEQLCKQAIALDPNDADVHAVYARLLVSYLTIYDPSPERRAAARMQAEQAAKLAPDSDEAQLALENFYRLQNPTRAEAERSLRALVARRPDFKRAWRILGHTSKFAGRYEEAIASYERAAALPGGDLLSLQNRAMCLGYLGRDQEAEAALDELLRLHPSTTSCTWKALYATYRADFAAAKTALDQVPAAARLEAFYVVTAAQLALWQREPRTANEVLSAMSGKIIEGAFVTSPKDYWMGLALTMANRPDAAEIAWRAAVKTVDEQLAANPSSFTWTAWKAVLLSKLGEPTDARRLFALAMQMEGANNDRLVKYRLLAARLRLGEREPAVDELKKLLRTNVSSIRGYVQYDPEFDGLRDEPWFRTLVAEATPPPSAPEFSAGALAKADDKSVAVLAFADLSAAHDSEYFSDGISEELLNVLAKVPGLKVTARTSAFFFKGKNLPIPEIAAKLGVAYVIEGSVQRAGERVKITAQLIKAADGFHVWSDTFTRDAKDVFAVEEEIAGLIAKQLSLKLGVSSVAATAGVNPQAFELFVRGREAWKLRTLADYDRAEDLLNRALALEPNFARAHAALADVWFTRAQDLGTIGGFEQRNSPEHLRIVARINQALALDPDSAEAHASLGGVAWVTWQFAEGERELRRAIVLNPNYATAHQLLGRLLLNGGRMDEALAELKLATESDPLAPRILDNYGLGLYLAGRYREAIAVDDRALALQPNSVQTLSGKARVLAASGRLAEALALVQTIPLESAGPGGRIARVGIFAQAGMKAEAEALLTGFDPKNRVSLLIDGLFALGRSEEAIGMLTPASLLASTTANYLFDPFYDSVRDDPRLVKIRAEVGLTEAHARAQAWRQAHPPEKSK